MNDRRNFFRRLLGTAGLFAIGGVAGRAIAEDVRDALDSLKKSSLPQAVRDEDLWIRIQQAFTVSPDFVYLNNAGVCPQPKIVQEALGRYEQLANEGPGHYMNRELGRFKSNVRRDLADLGGCPVEEIAINRNATEGLYNVVFGLPLKKGDEVVLARQDYSSLVNAWKYHAEQKGIKLIWVDLPDPVEDEEKLVRAYTEKFTSRTRLVQVTHMINWNGQILPAKKICQAARKAGIDSLVDGAQTFAHLDFSIADLECDYFVASLHKWLCAPFGTGLLYVRKEKIKGLLPLFPAPDPFSDQIDKFEHLGTGPVSDQIGISDAVLFHNAIGSKLKEERLRYLRDYWINGVKDIPEFRLLSPKDPAFSCGIGLFNLEGVDKSKISRYLLTDYNIFINTIVWENFDGVRVSPNVYTTTRQLDRLIQALHEVKYKD